MEEKVRRGRRPRNSLSQEAILDAAETLAIGGFDAVSMRAVAVELQASTMALYNHFATKEQLVDGLLDRVAGRFAPPLRTEDWVDDLRRFALAHRQILADHPWAVEPLFRQPFPGLGAARIGECALGILRSAGFSNARAVAAFSAIMALNYGWAAFTTVRDHDPDARGGEVAGLLALLPPEEFPITVEVSADMGAYGSEEHYGFALELLLIGLKSTAN